MELDFELQPISTRLSGVLL